MPKQALPSKIKGTRDILTEDWIYSSHVFNVVEEVVLSAGVDRIDIPILEKKSLYGRVFGEENENILKTIYSFDPSKIDGGRKKRGEKGEEPIALRPEMHSGFARMYIENNLQALPKPLSYYAMGRCFQNVNPQVGRFKELNQLAVEIIGDEDPLLDANLISLAWNLVKKLKIEGFEVQINSIGCNECLPKIKKSLSDFFKKKQSKLCEECKKKTKKDPLGILACKNEKCVSASSSAPLTLDGICENCKKHFMSVLEYLDEVGISYNLSPNLVKEYNYYNRTVFDFSLGHDKKHQNVIGEGGRMDYLIENLGGDAVPNIGLSINIDFLAEYIKNNGIKIPKPKSKVNVFIIQLGESAKKIAIKKAEEIRRLGVSTGIAIGKDTIKAQLKSAEKVGSLFTVIIGQREAVTNTALIRDMRDGVQETVELGDLNHKIFNMVEERIKEEEVQVKRQRLK